MAARHLQAQRKKKLLNEDLFKRRILDFGVMKPEAFL